MKFSPGMCRNVGQRLLKMSLRVQASRNVQKGLKRKMRLMVWLGKIVRMAECFRALVKGVYENGWVKVGGCGKLSLVAREKWLE